MKILNEVGCFIVVVLQEKVNCVVQGLVMEFCSWSRVHSGRQALCLVMVNNVCCHVEKAKALKEKCHCRIDCNCMLSIKHIVLISI
jgi:hypothetical protein